MIMGGIAIWSPGEGGVVFRWAVLDTGQGPVSGWYCSGPSPGASLVMVQSTAQSRLMAEPMARAVARRGHLVFVPTPGGNVLRNAVPLEEQRAKIVAAVHWCRDQGPAAGRPVYLSGHSIGANQAVIAAGVAAPDGVIAIGYDVETNTDREWSLLLVAGIYDQLHPAWKIKATAAQAFGVSVPDHARLYGNGAYLLSPLSDHHNEPLDPTIQQATAEWMSGQQVAPVKVWSSEVSRTVGAMLLSFGLFFLFVALFLVPRQRYPGPAAVVVLSLACWWNQGPEGPGQVRFWATVALAAGFALVLARAGCPALLKPRGWKVGAGLLALFLGAWTLATLLNGLPGIRVQPGSLLYLPFFVPYKFVCECYQLRGAMESMLVPLLPIVLAVMEAALPGKLGGWLWSWTLKMARAVSQFKLQLNFNASSQAWVALVITLAVAAAVWGRVLAEGYDLNLASLLQLAGLLARIAILPLALFVLALRSRWSRRLLGVENGVGE